MEEKGVGLLISVIFICIAQFLVQKENWLNRSSLHTKMLLKYTHCQ